MGSSEIPFSPEDIHSSASLRSDDSHMRIPEVGCMMRSDMVGTGMMGWPMALLGLLVLVLLVLGIAALIKYLSH